MEKKHIALKKGDSIEIETWGETVVISSEEEKNPISEHASKQIVGFMEKIAENITQMKGEKGDKGDRGEKGDKGDKGDRGEKGDKGDKGDRGEKGEDGKDGTIGKDWESAYQIARNAGFTGTKEEWLASLKGKNGDKGDRGARGEQGSPGQAVIGPPGPEGKDGAAGPAGPAGPQGDIGDLTNLRPEILVGLRMIFPTTATNDSNGNPTETIETGIGTTARKRKTNYAYNGDQNVTTQEIRILDSSDAFIYGIKKTFTYSGTSVASIAVEALLS